MKIELGSEVQDTVSGFKGIAMARSEFLFGCTRIGVQPKVGKDGKAIDPGWFDEPQLKVLKAPKIVQTPEQRKVGGPMPAIPTRSIPR